MNKPVTLTRRIPSFWSIVGQIRDEVRTSLNSYPEEIQDAGVMTASELIENAVKYSSDSDNGKDIGFELSADDDVIAIRVSNPSGSLEDYKTLSGCIDQTASAPDVKTLYIKQLTRLMENPCTGRTGLGIYRIAYEGSFSLSCSNEKGRVDITAVRPLQHLEKGAAYGNF